MPLTTAQAATALAAEPTVTVAVPSGSSEGLTVQVTLVYQIAFVPADLLTALKNQYGAAKVVSDKDVLTSKRYQFRIIP